MLNGGKLLIGENAPQGVQMDKGMLGHALGLLWTVQPHYGDRSRDFAFSPPKGAAAGTLGKDLVPP